MSPLVEALREVLDRDRRGRDDLRCAVADLRRLIEHSAADIAMAEFEVDDALARLRWARDEADDASAHEARIDFAEAEDDLSTARAAGWVVLRELIHDLDTLARELRLTRTTVR